MKPRQHNSWSRQQWLVVGILMLGFLLTVTSVPKNSVTMDEPVHALTGYSIIKTGDLRLIEDHPPFLEVCMGYPLSLDHELPKPETLAGWNLRERRTFANDAAWMLPPLDRWLFPARIPITFYLTLLCAVVYRWVTDIAGMPAGLICAALITCDPNFIAHAGLATLDVGVTTLSFASLFVLFRLLKNTSFRKVCCGGVVLGLALASKISALPLVPIAGFWMLIHLLRGKWSLKDCMKWSALYFSISILVVWGLHLFQVDRSPNFPWLIPAPTYWHSIHRITQHMVTENRFSFLLGRIYRGGVWTFFPVTFLLKTPEGALILLCVALICLPKIWRRQKYVLLFLGLYPLIYLTVSLSGALNLGYRHLLPVIPYVYTLLGINYSSLVKIKWLSTLHYVVVIWQITAALFCWPNYIPYFNVFAGGTLKGYQYLADSSVDWGQGLIAVREYVESHSLEAPKISAFTPFVDPSKSYGIQADLLPPQRGADVPLVLHQRNNPQPGDYILSASTLRGLQVADPEMYNWFWHREPQAVIAGAMLHYRVSPFVTEPAWVAQCSKPVTPLTNEDIAERFGIGNLRTVSFDCTQSWLFPGGGRNQGWFVLHSDALGGESILRDRMLEYSSLTFRQNIKSATPTHEVYLVDDPQYLLFRRVDLSVSPGGWIPSKAFNDGYSVTLPVQAGDLLTLIGLEVIETEEAYILWSMWQVDSKITVPISLMAHIIDVDNRVISNGDNFGIPYTELIPGDVFVQQHVLDTDAIMSDLVWIQTGVYRLDTLERYPVHDGVALLGDRILIPVVSKDR